MLFRDHSFGSSVLWIDREDVRLEELTRHPGRHHKVKSIDRFYDEILRSR